MTSEQDAWDTFAAAALTGYVIQDAPSPENCCGFAARYADAMMEERRKRKLDNIQPIPPELAARGFLDE